MKLLFKTGGNLPTQLKFKNLHGTVVLYEVSEDGEEHVLSGFASLGFCFDKDGVLLKYGEADKIEAYYKEVRELYKLNGLEDMANDLIFVSSDKWPVEEIDKFINNTGYIGLWYKREMEKAKSTPS